MNTIALELLASRICHDLISPIGAIHNGLEFMTEMGMENSDEALDLIGYSARMASARLQIFRIVYGAGGHDAGIEPRDIHKVFEELLAVDAKVKQDWDPEADLGFSPLPQDYCKILTGALMMAIEAIPKGGALTVTPAPNGGTLITATGESAFIRDYTEEALSHLLPLQDIDPRLVHPYVLGALSKECGLSITIEKTDDNRVDILIQTT